MIFTEGFGSWNLNQTAPIMTKWDGGTGGHTEFEFYYGYTKIPGRFSKTCIALNYDNSLYYAPFKDVGSDAHYIIGMAIKKISTSSTSRQLFGTLNGSSRVLSMVLGVDSKIVVKVGTTDMTTINYPIKTNRWNYIEVEHKLHASTGILKVWINEVLVYSFTGNTLGSTSFSNITRFDIWNTVGGSGAAIAIDDLYYLTSNGSTLPWGDTHIKEFQGTSDISNSGWTLSAGTDLFDVINKPFNAAGTPTLTASALNSKFLVDCSDVVGGTSAIVKAVAFNIRAIKSDAGAKNLSGLFKIGATEYLGTDTPLTASDDLIYDPFLLSPATGIGWTKAEVEAMSFGAKVTL